MREFLTKDVPTMLTIPTLKTKEYYLMKIMQRNLLPAPPETTAKNIVQMMMIHFTLVTMTTCLGKVTNKSPTSACVPPCHKSFLKNLTQSNLLHKPP